MLKQFQSFIKENNLFGKTDRILLAVSGGMDSMVMCHLFYKCGYNFGIAHANFGLRGNESVEDELFVKKIAEGYQVPFFTKSFRTKKIASSNKMSIQMSARTLRYSWFEELRKKNKFDLIATAHHQNDSIETILLNLARGTGIAGLHGIQSRSGLLVRPLLFALREDIEEYSRKNKIAFREDSSNQSDSYRRNKIRHRVIPVLKEINPSLEKTIEQASFHIQQVENIYKEYIQRKKEKLVTKKHDKIYIDALELFSEKYKEAILFEILSPLEFNQAVISNISRKKELSPGKKFLSDSHVLIIERKRWVIESTEGEKKEEEIYEIHSDTKIIKVGRFTLKVKTLKDISPEKLIQKSRKKGTDFAFLDSSRLKFPLVLRAWKQGDAFHPLGMTGKKKLSDFLTDLKIPASDKKETFVLCSGDQIAWVVGYRIDGRFRVSNETKSVAVLEWLY